MAKTVPEYSLISFQELRESQFPALLQLIRRVYKRSSFYRAKLDAAGIKPEDIQSFTDFSHIPFTVKQELREYPLEYMRAAEEEEIVRIHSSSGTTGKPTIIPYTKNDVGSFTAGSNSSKGLRPTLERDSATICWFSSKKGEINFFPSHSIPMALILNSR
jgi:phenylacetate-coenzyme A ligase PaaK-like adenylate-forming protein